MNILLPTAHEFMEFMHDEPRLFLDLYLSFDVVPRPLASEMSLGGSGGWAVIGGPCACRKPPE